MFKTRTITGLYEAINILEGFDKGSVNGRLVKLVVEVEE